MKKIYIILLTATALFAFSSIVNAQGDYSIAKQITDPLNNNATVVFPPEKTNPVKIDEENKIAYAKNVSQPFKNGTYWIKLETFATGTAEFKMSSEPADIVLVLDFSQSMTNQYSTTATYVPYVNNTYQNINQQGRDILYEGEYRQVQIRRLQRNGQNVGFNNGGYAWAYFQVGTTTYYLDGYGDNAQIRVANDPTNMSDHPVWSGTGNFGNNTVMWPDVLYVSDSNVSRLEALKVAVNNFIDVIYHNDNYDENENLRDEPLGNRISIVMFSTEADTEIVGNGWTDVSTSSREKNTELLNAFIAVTNTPMQTHADVGMSKAITLLSQIDEDRMAEASRTVVLFTDGAPGENASWTNPTSTNVANNTITYSKTVKTSYSATVFSVLVGNATGDMVTYMNAVTSNYPEATRLDNLGTVCTDSEYYSGEKEYLYKKTADFYKNAGQDLSGVFEEIAHQSGGGSNASLSAATSTVDIVSNSFILPDGVFETGADINDYVKVFTAKLKTIENGEYVFEEEILAPYSEDTYDVYENDVLTQEGVDVDGTVDNPTISVVLEGTNSIKVTGFDYANNWCGPVEHEDGSTTYHGHKIIIMIPIKMNPDAVGGPNVATNAEGSGILIPGQTDPVITFDSPSVSLPVNIYLQKIGLQPGESAKFKIERAVLPDMSEWTEQEVANWDPSSLTDWHYVSTVFVTRTASGAENPIVKIKGMPSTIMQDNEQVDLIYRVTEENWSWSYTILNTEEFPNPQYTVTSKVDNPFKFKNEKKANIEFDVRHAESKATNVFSGNGSVEYTDSKNRETPPSGSKSK